MLTWPMMCCSAQIKYGVCGVGAVGDTFGLAFMLNEPATTTLKVTPDPEVTGCFVYRVRTIETFSACTRFCGVAATM